MMCLCKENKPFDFRTQCRRSIPVSTDVPAVWLRFAKEDLQAAEVLIQGEQYNQACFHAQQSVERILKALLKIKGLEIPRICLIAELLEQCYIIDEHLETFAKDAQWMDKYYHSTRYPDVDPTTLPDHIPQKDESIRALRIARQIFEYTLKAHFKRHKVILFY